MSLPRAIILAAGQGAHLGALTATCPKILLPVDGEPLLVRTVRQLVERNFNEISVVVGHQRASIERALAPWNDLVEFVGDANCATDPNLHALVLGLASRDEPALVVEADLAFDEHAMDAIAEVAEGEDSVWFTNDSFRPRHVGGILRAGESGAIDDLRYAPAFEKRFSAYRQVIGLVYVGPHEMPGYHRWLREAAARNPAQSHLVPWCRHLGELPARECDLSDCRIATFDSPADYRRCCELFSLHVTV